MMFSKKSKEEKRRGELNLDGNAPCMEFSSNREVVLEGSRGVLHYAEDLIRINTNEAVISFHGRNLNLKCISPSALIIDGFITSVEFTV